MQLYDWLTMNKLAVKDLLRGFDSENKGSLETEDFFTSMASMAMPLTEEGKAKLLTVYDKKGEGKISYNDLLSDHKYIHAVSGHSLVGVAWWVWLGGCGLVGVAWWAWLGGCGLVGGVK